MTIYDVLRHEHDVIRTCLRRIQELGERRPVTRQRHFRQLQTLIGIHAAAVEAIFHGPLRGYELTGALARRGCIRHDLAGSLMEVIAGLEPEDPDWTAYVAVLGEVLELHMRQEEKEMFRKAHKVLDTVTEELMGEAMRLARKGGETQARTEIPPVLVEAASRSLH